MDNTTFVVAATAIGATIGTLAYCLKLKSLKKLKSNGNQQKLSRFTEGFPNTQLAEEDSLYLRYADDECKGSDKTLRDMFVSIMNKMQFKEVDIDKISKREKVFEFKLKFGYKIRILSSINNGKDKAVFTRKTFKVGLVDAKGDYVDHDHYPRLGAVDHSKGTLGNVIDKLMERIDNICDEMEDEYLQQ